MNNLCLQAFNLAPKNGSPAFGNLHFDRCRHSPVKKIFVSFTRKYAVPPQIKPKILELSIRRRQSNLSSLYFFSCEEKDYHCVVSVAKLGLTAARTVKHSLRTVHGRQANHFFAGFFLYLSREV